MSLSRLLPLVVAAAWIGSPALAQPSKALKKEIENNKAAKKGELVQYGYMTFDQNQWGEPEATGKSAPSKLSKHFKKAFPDGLIIGDQDGKDDDDLFALRFMTADSVKHFLPQSGPPRTLVANTKDGNQKLGGLAGQLVTAKLNIRMNELGLIDGKGKKDGPKISDLVFVKRKEIPDVLDGVRVGDLIEFADRVISSEFGVYKETKKDGAVEYDVNGDDKPDLSLRDVRIMLRLVNVNFQGGNKDRGFLEVAPKKKMKDKKDPDRRADKDRKAGEDRKADKDRKTGDESGPKRVSLRDVKRTNIVRKPRVDGDGDN